MKDYLVPIVVETLDEQERLVAVNGYLPAQGNYKLLMSLATQSYNLGKEKGWQQDLDNSCQAKECVKIVRVSKESLQDQDWTSVCNVTKEELDAAVKASNTQYGVALKNLKDR